MKGARAIGIAALVCAVAAGVGVVTLRGGDDPQAAPLGEVLGSPGKTAAEHGMPPIECPAGAKAVRTSTEQFCIADGAGAAVRHGPYVVYQRDDLSRKRTEGWFEDGARNGTWRNWYPSGALRSELEYVDGLAQGSFESWYESGAVQTRGEYVDDRQSGTWTTLGEDGSTLEKGSYNTGVRRGPWVGYYTDGSKRYERDYRADGTDSWTEWSETGDVTSQHP